jgi:hypothetical protein
MKKTVVLVHDKARSDGIHEFENSGNEEYNSGNESAEAFKA